MDTPDLLVVGGGTAAISAARMAIRRGASVTMVTDAPPGGDCTFTGCVPSKTLLSAGHLPFPEAIARVHATVAGIAAEESAEVLREEGIDVVLGRGDVQARDRVVVGDRTYRPKRLLLAVGSEPVVPPIDGLADVPYLTNESLFDLTALPRHLAVLGGGAIGAEMAQAFRRFGAQVTVLEAADRLLSKEEPEASQVVQEAFEAQGIDVRTGTKVTSVARGRGTVRITTSEGALTATHLLVAVGRRPGTAGLELPGLRKAKSGAIEVDLRMRTSVKGVYAAGDCTGRLPFTHAADEMARAAVDNAVTRWRRTKFVDGAVPWVTFTDPEVARIGLSEAEAAEQVKGARVVELPMSDVDRARTSDRTEGFVKVIVAPKLLTREIGGGTHRGGDDRGPPGRRDDRRARPGCPHQDARRSRRADQPRLSHLVGRGAAVRRPALRRVRRSPPSPGPPFVIRLVTDSAAQATPEILESTGALVVPLTVTVDGEPLLEGSGIDLAGITAALERGAAVGSSTPSPGQFLQAYQQAAAEGATRVLSLHSGGSASGTANTARLAAGMAEVPVEVVDTGSVSFPVAMALWSAGDALAAGGSLADAGAAARETVAAMGNVFVVRTLGLARRGGRLAATDEAEGVPVLALEQGQMRPVGRAGDPEQAVAAMADYVREHAAGRRLRVGVGHVGAAPVADALEAALRERGDLEVLVRYDMGPSVAVHTGLGTAGCCFHPV